MWCEQNVKRTLSAVSRLKVNLPFLVIRACPRAHSPFERENYREFFETCSRGSSGGAAGSVRPSLETFVVFNSFSLCLTKCGACTRTWNDLVFRRLALLPVLLARGVVPDNFPRTSGALVASSCRFACPRCRLLRGVPLCLIASPAGSRGCPRISALSLRWLFAGEQFRLGVWQPWW